MIDTSLDSSNFYFLLAVVQGIILASLILLQKPLRKASLFFGILLFLFTLSLLHIILEESISGFNAKFPIPMEFGLAYGPLAYFHILYIKDPKRTFRKIDFLHFLPSFLLDVLFFMFTFLYIRANEDWAYENLLFIQGGGLISSLGGTIPLGIYSYFIYRESREAKLVLREFEKIKKWLNYLIIAWSCLIAFLIVAVPIGLIFIEKVDENSAYLYKPLGTILVGWIYLLGYSYLLKYSRIVETYTKRVSKFSFSPDELEDRKNQILHALQEDRLYQNSSLTIAKLAQHLGWPINSLSTLINEYLQTNFNDLINHYRIVAFKDRVIEADSQKYTMVGLGQEVGFSSKASFYRAFKKETGMTPSDFIKSQG